MAFCFIGGGSEFKRMQRWAEEWGNAEKENRKAEILCLPYQPLAQLSSALSSADAHVVVMGNEFVGLVHPCKIYNILAVGAPVIYIGPKPSHVTDLLDRLGDEHPSIRVAHGEAEALASQILDLRQNMADGRRPLSMEVTAAFSKCVLLPKLIGVLEDLPDY